MELTERQEQIVVGSLLGDGYIHRSPESESSLEVRQAETRESYIRWLAEELGDIAKPPRQRRDNKQWRVYTRYLPIFTRFRDLFYRDGRKVVPDSIERWLRTPLALAVWYMDDGTVDYRPRSHYAFRLTTNCFSRDDHERLQRALQKNFGVHATIQRTTMRGKLYLRLHIGRESRDTFAAIVRPLVLPCFSYKIPI